MLRVGREQVLDLRQGLVAALQREKDARPEHVRGDVGGVAWQLTLEQRESVLASTLEMQPLRIPHEARHSSISPIVTVTEASGAAPAAATTIA